RPRRPTREAAHSKTGGAPKVRSQEDRTLGRKTDVVGPRPELVSSSAASCAANTAREAPSDLARVPKNLPSFSPCCEQKQRGLRRALRISVAAGAHAVVDAERAGLLVPGGVAE